MGSVILMRGVVVFNEDGAPRSVVQARADDSFHVQVDEGNDEQRRRPFQVHLRPR
jgi:hypothetical protein